MLSQLFSQLGQVNTMEGTAHPAYFGEWLKYRRKKLDLTQAELAQRAGCSVPALRKIESGERRPSKQLAGLLANSVEIPLEDLKTFISVARGELSIERLKDYTAALSGVSRPGQEPRSSSGNLPGMLTPFVGREPELASLNQLLLDPQCRLLTLAGPGGIGKTRLAIEVAAQCKDTFPDGVWLVSLAPLRSPAFLVSAIADALNVKLQDTADPQKQLLHALREKKALLILDNAEHLLEGVGLFAEILKASSQIKLLVTSRERLNLLSEWVFEIQGLPVPTSSQMEQFEQYSSVKLFLQSARRTQADFKLPEAERQWVVRICQIVEGLPLGIELAAAWVNLLSCEEIAREIEQNLGFLAASLRDLPGRHRSLRATLDHSWNLLNPQEKTILSRLSVFRGSFQREAAEEVCGAGLGVLSSLKSKSLLRRTDAGRYDLHELIHQYAGARLAEDPNEYERLKDQHAKYFARRLSEWEQALKSSQQMETLAVMAEEIDNLRQAWQRMVTCCDFDCCKNTLFNPDLFHSSLFSLSLLYELRCRNAEAVSVFEEAVECLQQVRPPSENSVDEWSFEAVLGHVMAYLGLHYAYSSQYQRARDIQEKAITLLEKGGAKLEKAQAQVMLAWNHQSQGRAHDSINLLEEALAIFQNEGDLWWVALANANLGWCLISIGKIKEGKAHYQEGLRLAASGDLRLRVPILNGLGYASYLEKDFSTAEKLLEENREQSVRLGNQRQTALCFLDLGQVALAAGRTEQAEKNFQEAANLLSEFGEPHDMALVQTHFGKSFAARQETEPARRKFLQVIRIGQTLGIFHLVFWGFVNLAEIDRLEGKKEQALETALVLKQYSVELKDIQDDFNCLWADLQSSFSPTQIEAVVDRTQGEGIEALLGRIQDFPLR